jgi:predicted HAD superfamily Cof-like phosphohydrolase
MKDQINAVATFHKAFKVEIAQSPTTNINKDIVELRHRLMSEENEEYIEAVKSNDLVEVADALGDMMYILCGTILTHGMQDIIETVFNEIQQSNMSKLGVDGNPIYRNDGKVMKGPNYKRPNLKQFLD